MLPVLESYLSGGVRQVKSIEAQNILWLLFWVIFGGYLEAKLPICLDWNLLYLNAILYEWLIFLAEVYAFLRSSSERKLDTLATRPPAPCRIPCTSTASCLRICSTDRSLHPGSERPYHDTGPCLSLETLWAQEWDIHSNFNKKLYNSTPLARMRFGSFVMAATSFGPPLN